MDRNAISKAHSRLRNAERAITGMEASQDFADLYDHWVAFLMAWKGVYTILEQGAKTSAQSMQWFGRIRAQRKNDDLLQFLFAARNDEEHGLANSLFDANNHQIYDLPDADTPDRKVHIRRDPLTGRQWFERSDGGPISLIKEFTVKGALIPVSARGGITYGPPIRHLGNAVETPEPILAATLGLAYVRALVKVAEGLQTS